MISAYARAWRFLRSPLETLAEFRGGAWLADRRAWLVSETLSQSLVLHSAQCGNEHPAVRAALAAALSDSALTYRATRFAVAFIPRVVSVAPGAFDIVPVARRCAALFLAHLCAGRSARSLPDLERAAVSIERGVLAQPTLSHFAPAFDGYRIARVRADLLALETGFAALASSADTGLLRSLREHMPAPQVWSQAARLALFSLDAVALVVAGTLARRALPAFSAPSPLALHFCEALAGHPSGIEPGDLVVVDRVAPVEDALLSALVPTMLDAIGRSCTPLPRAPQIGRVRACLGPLSMHVIRRALPTRETHLEHLLSISLEPSLASL